METEKIVIVGGMGGERYVWIGPNHVKTVMEDKDILCMLGCIFRSLVVTGHNMW